MGMLPKSSSTKHIHEQHQHILRRRYTIYKRIYKPPASSQPLDSARDQVGEAKSKLAQGHSHPLAFVINPDTLYHAMLSQDSFQPHKTTRIQLLLRTCKPFPNKKETTGLL